MEYYCARCKIKTDCTGKIMIIAGEAGKFRRVFKGSCNTCNAKIHQFAKKPVILLDSEEPDEESEEGVVKWNMTEIMLDQALKEQERIDPDKIFRGVHEVVMEKIFPNLKKKTRRKSDEENWTEESFLTLEEIAKYKKLQGYQ